MSEAATYYFFDTSALVKRYHDEIGTAAVDQAFDEDAVCLISDLTIIECHSAFAKKVRTQEIGEEDYRVAMHRIMQEINQVLLRVRRLREPEKQQAAAYGTSHGLRTLDAMQLAVLQTVYVLLIGCIVQIADSSRFWKRKDLPW